MELIKIDFNSWHLLTIEINWFLAVLIVIAVCVIVFIIRRWAIRTPHKHITVDRIKLGIDGPSIELKYNNKDREIAYKIWVELNTRKIGLVYDEKNDVISEVYDSWYQAFGIIRELLKELPADQVRESSKLVKLVIEVLNCGLRPHLTKWQARFRKWYKEALKSDDYRNQSPQEIQKQYPYYNEIVKDIKQTNKYLIEMQALMEKIAFGT